MAGHGRRTLLFAALLGYGLIFVALSIDVLARVWTSRFQFETPVDVAVLLYFEGTRALITVAGLVVATIAYLRARQHPALGWLGLGLAFATIAYTKAAGFDAFPGAAQHDIATALTAARVPRWLLLVVFGQPEWALWLALAALLAFARLYPRPLAPHQVTRRSARPRTGTMRSVALAGTDVGGIARHGTATLLERGWFDGRRLWSTALAVAVLHTGALLLGTARSDSVVKLAAVVVFAVVAGMFVTLLRAGGLAAAPAERGAVAWLWRAGVAGLALLALSAVTGALLPGAAVSVAAFTLAPAAVLVACLLAVLATPPAGSAADPEADPAADPAAGPEADRSADFA
jgi:hypothetical protein